MPTPGLYFCVSSLAPKLPSLRNEGIGQLLMPGLTRKGGENLDLRCTACHRFTGYCKVPKPGTYCAWPVYDPRTSVPRNWNLTCTAFLRFTD